eukprot:CAMPEP_0172474408 /NCGR_PEP_ID=MMETSP1065-20121228/69342_1 /TAXON_ID=265537 /ORGANISM="Amphiprora paludosa, Strain CCMP125" /LENGTH=246 /DNA_ID=CAMNT_0013232589 /DNA_START=73 /DNA_END=816 /DNA_ORIENTATION=-
MAEYLVLPVVNLHLVPSTMSNAVAVFCEPLAAACRIVEQNLIDASAQDKVLILGDGKLGLMIAEAIGRHMREQQSSSQSTSIQPILVGKHQHKLDLVQEAGIEPKLLRDIATAGDDGSLTVVKPEYQHGFDVVVDATGSPAGLAMATSLTRPMGKLILKSTCAANANFFAAPIVIDEIQIVGSRCGPFPPALRLLSLPDDQGGLRVQKYVTKTFRLADAEAAVACAAERSTMKVQLICGPEEEELS